MRLHRTKFQNFKGVYTFDLLIAVIAIIAIFYVTINSIDLLTRQITTPYKNLANSMLVLAISEQAIKRDFVRPNGQLLPANLIDGNLNFQSILDEWEIYYDTPISIEISLRDGRKMTFGPTNEKAERTCIRRFVVYRDGVHADSIGYIDVCA